MPIVSIVVPVYKVEKYLRRCVNSLTNQTLSDIEIILVDDGSPDKCPEICDELANSDSRIKVVHQKNSGVAAARNKGMHIATGEYMAFVDSDDYVEPEMYGEMYKVAKEHHCDIVMCDCKKEFVNRSENYTHDIRAGYYSRDELEKEYFPHLIMMENVEYPATISNWVLLFKNPKGICYIEGVRFSEDLLFGAQLMYHANSFYYMKGKCYYHYVMNPGSATHTFRKDKWKDYMTLYHAAKGYFSDCTEYNFLYQIDLMLLFFVYNAVGDILNANLPPKEKRKYVRAILKDSTTTKMFSNLSICKLEISTKQKLLTYLYKSNFIAPLLFKDWIEKGK